MLASMHKTYQIWWALARAGRLLLVASHPAPKDRLHASALVTRDTLRSILTR